MDLSAHMFDFLIVISYLIITLVIGYYAGRKIKTAKEYILSDKPYSTPIIIATFLATLIGGGHTSGTASKIYEVGLIYSIVVSGTALMHYLSAKIVAPKMYRFKGMLSVGDIMYHLYGKEARLITALAGLIKSFGSIGGQILAMGYLLESLLNIPVFYGVFISGGIVILYSSFGGVKSVTATDVFQFIILIIVIPTISSICISKVGGVATLLSKVPSDKLTILNRDDLLAQLSSFILFATPYLAPHIVHRYLLAGSEIKIKKALYAAAIIEIPLLIMLSGISFATLILFPDLPSNDVLPNAIKVILPPVIKGFAIIGLLAVIMSTADSILNSASVLVVHDVIQHSLGVRLKDSQKIFLMSLFTWLVGIFSIGFAFSMKGVISVIIYFGCFYMPVVTVPLLAGIIGIKANRITFLASSLTGLVSFILLDLLLDDKYESIGYLASMLISIIAFAATYYYQSSIALKLSILSFINKKIFLKLDAKNYVQNFKLTKLLQWINPVKFSQQRVEYYGAEYIWFAIFGCINFIVPYFMFAQSDVQFYPLVIAIRVIVGILCLLLLLKDYWPQSLKPYLPLYWHIVLLVYLPLHTTFMFMLEKASLEWFLNMALSIFMLSALVDWLAFIIIMPLGILLGYSLFYLVINDYNFTINESTFVVFYMYLFSSIIGLIFTRKKSISDKEKLDALKTFSGAIAHEIRTPLSIIQMQVNNLDKQREKTLEIQKNSLAAIEHSNSLIDMVLMNVKDSIVIKTEETASIGECINAALTKYQFTNQEKDYLNVEIFDDFEVIGNKDYITHVFLNLLKNSIYYLKSTERPLIKIVAKLEGDKKIVTFYDNGEGIDDEALSKIFNPLYTSRTYGTGIGLSFCKMVMESYGGSISCTSEKYNYTLFTLEFR